MMQTRLLVCVNKRLLNQPSCATRGGVEIAEALEKAISEQQLPLTVQRFYCLGHCQEGANVKIAPQGQFFHSVTLADIPLILKTALSTSLYLNGGKC
ncbi:hypothetical protein BegalDRAFT_2564 [Beggiatoa alba B18LD]|uniref:Ferredoxin n=1 Tax=Beggiatoa alba B18LD TaxID=395493 RepID=I3CIG4_9GAMM|nr:(2Fe-2S) ferredoxin domain-containing protein [Beggiatoa alba]EIJ43407.1 hypothetical protein BegalDRAFT_2564 [Beggiatoa alba B18LD]